MDFKSLISVAKSGLDFIERTDEHRGLIFHEETQQLQVAWSLVELWDDWREWLL
jgi:hypothetical protein